MSLIKDLLQFIREGQKLYLPTFGTAEGLYLWKTGNNEIERKSIRQLFLLRDDLTQQHGEHTQPGSDAVFNARLTLMTKKCCHSSWIWRERWPGVLNWIQNFGNLDQGWDFNEWMHIVCQKSISIVLSPGATSDKGAAGLWGLVFSAKGGEMQQGGSRRAMQQREEDIAFGMILVAFGKRLAQLCF